MDYKRTVGTDSGRRNSQYWIWKFCERHESISVTTILLSNQRIHWQIQKTTNGSNYNIRHPKSAVRQRWKEFYHNLRWVDLISLVEQDFNGKFEISECLRKRARGDVTIKAPGTGKISINGEPITYFENIQCREQVSDLFYTFSYLLMIFEMQQILFMTKHISIGKFTFSPNIYSVLVLFNGLALKLQPNSTTLECVIFSKNP